MTHCAALVLAGVACCADPALPESRALDAAPDTGAASDPGDSGPPDAAPAGPPLFAPLHVAPEAMLEDAPDLMIIGDSEIDTTALTINGATNPYFVRHGEYAVLFTRELRIIDPVKVRGGAPLIVVATGPVRVSALIDAAARGGSAGPGAQIAGGAGAGTAGSWLAIEFGVSSGGGGASHGTPGARGGSRGELPTPGQPGELYGEQITDPLVGGSRGGGGGQSYPSDFGGGAGGGAIQISSAVSIEISMFSMISVGGGGGASGGYGSTGGGGGGSGGSIVLEAPEIRLSPHSSLEACGGGGGAGGCGAGGCIEGTDGADSRTCQGPPEGGEAGVPIEGWGGTGAGGMEGRYAEAQPGIGYVHAGGGGGGAGLIWLRHRAATPPVIESDWIAPAVRFDPTLP